MSAVWYVLILLFLFLFSFPFFHIYPLIAWGGEQSYSGRAGAANSPLLVETTTVETPSKGIFFFLCSNGIHQVPALYL